MEAQSIESTEIVPGWRETGESAQTDDKAPQAAADGGLPLPTLKRFLNDVENEPEWRREADLACDYYDGNQLAQEVLEQLAEKSLGPLVRNLIAPTVDAVLGLEEKNRQDWRVVTDLEEQQEVAEGLSQKLAESERESQADRAISDAYAGAVKAGFASVEVSRASNPFSYPYRVEAVHRRELYWDPRSRKPDWSDARFVLRRRWYDIDIVAAYFPEHRALIKAAGSAWGSGWEEILRVTSQDSTELLRALDMERLAGIEEQEWRDTSRGRVCVYEVWYRTFHRGLTMKLPGGRVVEFDRSRPEHQAVVNAGLARPMQSVFDKYRCAYFVGPHRIADFASECRKFPYIPFWGKREDLTGAPYGLIRSMMSVQDEINARLAKMMWLLSSRRTVIDDDAVSGVAAEFNDMSDVSREVGNSNAFIVLNSGRRNADAMRVDENLELAEAQHRAMQDAQMAMSQVSGVYSQMLGNAGTLTANSAIKTVLDQGTVTLAEINANYIYGRRLVGEQLLELIKQDSLHPHQLTVDTGATKKQVYFNKPVQDPATGLSMVENSVAATPVKVQLTDVPSTASYRQQQLVSLSEVVKSLPPEAQGVMSPFLVENTDLPQRKELARILRERLGIAVDPKSPEGQQIQAQQAEQAALIKEMQVAEIDLKKAQANKANADAAKAGVEAQPEMMQAQFQREDAQKQREHEAKLAEIDARRQGEVAKADGERRRADADVEIAKTAAASDQKLKALSEEFDSRLQELEDELSERDAERESEDEGKPPVVVDVNGNVAKQLEKQHGERMAARKAEKSEGKQTTAGLMQAIEKLAQMTAQSMEQMTRAQTDAMRQQAEMLSRQFAQMAEQAAAQQQQKSAKDDQPRVREVEITDPETGKPVRARVRSRKDESGKIVREVEMVDPVTGQSVRTSRNQ